MYKYKNEAHFSKAVVSHLRKQGWFVQRIETGSIGRGVPDIYAVSPLGDAVWLELKRIHTTVRGKRQVSIPWRPGQQSWLRLVNTYKQNAFTLAAFDDCILRIPHNTLHKNDIVDTKNCIILWSISDL